MDAAVRRRRRSIGEEGSGERGKGSGGRRKKKKQDGKGNTKQKIPRRDQPGTVFGNNI